ncbi:MAG: hypothetical protein AB9873_12165 [Syntrophobacteraceae bacterium]
MGAQIFEFPGSNWQKIEKHFRSYLERSGLRAVRDQDKVMAEFKPFYEQFDRVFDFRLDDPESVRRFGEELIEFMNLFLIEKLNLEIQKLSL